MAFRCFRSSDTARLKGQQPIGWGTLSHGLHVSEPRSVLLATGENITAYRDVDLNVYNLRARCRGLHGFFLA